MFKGVESVPDFFETLCNEELIFLLIYVSKKILRTKINYKKPIKLNKLCLVTNKLATLFYQPKIWCAMK